MLRDERREFRSRGVRRIVLVDLCNDPQHLRKRPICRALAVREAAPAHHRCASRVEATRELTLQPRFTDAWRAQHRDEMRMAVAGGAFPDRGQERELAIASDHLDVGSRPSDGTRRDGQPRAKRFLLSFGFDRADRSVRDRASREPVRLLAHHESARPGCGLQPLEAVLTTSPMASASPGGEPEGTVTTASPLFTAARASSFKAATASRVARPARTARSASAPCETGAPNTPITASPMNCTTVPPEV